MVDEGRLPLPFALITFTIAVGARWATQSHRSIGEFMGVNSPITGPILEGSRGQIPYLSYPDLVDTGVRPPLARENLPIRPYLHARISRITVVEQLPQIIIIIIKIRRPNCEALENFPPANGRPVAGVRGGSAPPPNIIIIIIIITIQIFLVC